MSKEAEKSKPEKKLSKREAARIRLDNQYVKWLKASASKLDIEDLLRAGKISAEQARESEQQQGQIPAGDIPATVSGMDALGSLIMRNFPKIGLQVGRQTIQNWRGLKYVPNGCNVPFPPPSNGNRYRVSDCFAWVETYFGPRMDTVGQPEPLFGETQAHKNRREAALANIAERQDRLQAKTLMVRADAEKTISAALKRYHGIVRVQLERTGLKLITDYHAALNLSDEQKAALREFHIGLARETISKVETACELIGRGETPEQEILPDKPAEKQKQNEDTQNQMDGHPPASNVESSDRANQQPLRN